MSRIKTNFVLPHKSTNWAFVDGLGCGVIVAYLAKMAYDSYLEYKTPDPWATAETFKVPGPEDLAPDLFKK